MATAYRGYFYGLDDCDRRYRVELIPHPEERPVWQEITLAAQPCVVTYDSESNPFEPVVKSHMAVNVISGDWLFDLYSQDAHSCVARLLREESNTHRDELVWCGYVTNNLLNMPQDGCINTFTVQCDDCITTLDNYDYETLSTIDGGDGHKQVITFADLLRIIATKCGLITDIVFDATLISPSGTNVPPTDLKISERNFFSSDIEEEPWKMSEALEEMCRWLCMTAVQVGSTLHIFDRQGHVDSIYDTNTADVRAFYNGYSSHTPFSTYTLGQYMVDNITYRLENVGGSGSDISMETVYNTITVTDSFFEIGEFVPDLYEDDYLTNYDGDKWKAVNVPAVQPYKPYYLDKKERIKEDADDSVNDYYMKQWMHKWYTPTRYMQGTLEPALYADLLVMRTGTSHTGTSEQMTSFTATYHLKNRNPNTKTHTISLTEYYNDGIRELWYRDNVASAEVTLDAFEETDVSLTLSSFHHQDTSDLIPQFKCDNGNYVRTGQETLYYWRPTQCLVTAEISDMATAAKAKDESFYDRQIADTISWDRYIMVSQLNSPSDEVNPRRVTQAQAMLLYPPILTLNSGWYNPMILDDKAFLAINGKAKIERYERREYINSNWAGDATGVGGYYNCNYWGIITGTENIYTFPLALWFKLKVGDYYWNGSEWTTTSSLFYVDVSTNIDEDGYVDFEKLWNTDFNVINNISYTEYSGASGYKIPLTGVTFDFSKPIQFEVHLPSRVQLCSSYPNGISGMNQYVYISDLDISLFTKGSEKMDLSDVMYENVINEGSNNDMSEITCRFTTYPDEGQHSYSSVGYQNVLATTFRKYGLDSVQAKMEENIVKTYANEYSTPTISQTVVMDMSPSILSRIKDTDLDKYFHITGMEINYAEGVKTISLVESKQYNE